MYQRVLKFNPYHAEDGRFTTGESAGALVKRVNAGETVDMRRADLHPALYQMAADEKNHPNLANVRVEGEHVFSSGNLGIPRVNMPQVPSDHMDKFLSLMPGKHEHAMLDPASLKPSQGEIDGMKVAQIYRKIQQGEPYTKPILVSSDGYIMDGHHHWGARRAMRVFDQSAKVPAIRFDRPQHEMMRHMHGFAAAHGIASKPMNAMKVLKFNPYHDPANGQFTGPNEGGSADGAASHAVAQNLSRVMVANQVVEDFVAKNKQDVADKDALYAKAKEAHAQMQQILDQGQGISDQMGYKHMQQPPETVTDEQWREPGGMLFIAPLKGQERAAEKVQSEYGGKWESLMDLTRATIATDSLSEMKTVLAKLQGAGVKIIRAKNRFAKALPSGYRDILLNVEFPNGHIGELQLHAKSMLRAKGPGGGHHLYELERKITGKYKEKGVNNPSLFEPSDQTSYYSLIDKQNQLYNMAWGEVRP